MFHVLPIKVIIELPLVFRQTSFSNCGFARACISLISLSDSYMLQLSQALNLFWNSFYNFILVQRVRPS